MTTATTCRPRRGQSQCLGNGIRHEHTVACTTGSTTCQCPYSFWQPRTTPRRWVRVAGSIDEAHAVRQQMRRDCSRIVYPGVTTPTPTMSAVTGTDPVPTLAEWAEHVFTVAWRNLANSTRGNRRRTYKLYIENQLGTLHMNEVTPLIIENWLAELTDKGVGVPMQRFTFDIVHVMLGIWTRRLGQPNPVSYIPRPRRPQCEERRAKDRTLTAEQYQHLLTTCRNTSDELMIRTATEAGLRTGELCGLQRRDVNLTACTITVERQGNRNTTKTGVTRTVSITPTLADLFKLHLADLAGLGFTMPTAYIWQGGFGPRKPENNRPYGAQAIYKIVRRILTRADLDKVTNPHGLRATGATLASQAGVPIKIISQQLGHSSERMTQDHYIGNAEVGELAAYGAAFE